MGGGAGYIDDLIVGLSAQGRLVRARGLFEIDRDEAREKMQRFRLEDPHLYIIELMQAAYLLGATFVAARVEANQVTVRFDGDPLFASDFSQVYAAAFARRKTRRDLAMRHLALALGAVRGLDPSKIVIESSTIDGASRLTIMPGRADKIEEGLSLRGNATTVTVRKRFRLDRVFGVWRDSEERFPERVLLQRRCGYSNLAITLDGDRLSVGKDVSELFPSSHKFKSSTEVGFVGVRPGKGLSSITLMQFGVIVDEYHFSNPLYTVRAIIESERLNQNLTRSAFIKDAAWEEFQDIVLTQEVHRALRRLLEPLLHGGGLVPAELLYDEDEHAEQDWVLQMNSTWLRALALEVLRECGDMRARGRVLTGHTRALAVMIESLPMWLAADKLEGVEPWQQSFVPMSELGVGIDADAELAWASSQVREVRFEPGGRRVLLVRDYDAARPLEVIQRYTQARTVDVTEYLRRRWIRHQNISLWSWRPPYPELDFERFSTSVSAELPGSGVTLEIAMHRAGRNVAEWVVVHDHKMLCLSRLDGVPFPGMTIVWRGVFGVNELYDDVFVDEDIFRLALRTVDLLVEFFFDRAARLPGANRKMFLAFFELVVSGQLAPMLLRSMGMWRMEYSRIFEEWWARRSRDVTSVWWLAHLAEHQARSDAELLRARDLLGPLSQLELFESISGQRVASSEVLASAIVDERLAIVHEEHASESRRAWRQIELDRTIIIADRGAERILRLLLSPRRLQVFDYELAMMAGRARYLRERERAASVEGAFVIRAGIDQAGVVGQIGLLEGDSRSPGVLDTSLLYLHRLLGRVEFDVPFGRLSAVVNSDSLRPSKSWRSARQDEHYDLVCRVLRDAVRQLYISWLDHVTATPGSLTGSPAALDQFLRFCAVVRYSEPDERLAERAWQARCLVDLHGDRVSLADVVRATDDQEDVFFVVGEVAAQVARAGGPSSFVLALPEGFERPAELLGALFPDKHRVLSLGDHSRDQAALERARARFMTRPVVDLDLGGEPILSRRFADATRRGVIGLLDDPSPLLAIGKLSLTLCHEDRHVTRVIHDIPIGRFEVIIDDDDLIEWERSDEVSPLARVDIERLMTRQAAALLVGLCQQVEHEPESIDAKTRHMLRCYLWKVSSAGAALDELRHALMNAPLFYVLGAGWRDATQLLDDAGDSGELFYAIESWGIERAALLEQSSSRRIVLFEDDESRDALGRIFPDVNLSPCSSATSTGEDPAQRIAPEAPREDEAQRPLGDASGQAEISLRERVVELLLGVRGERRVWLDDALVEQITFEALAGDRSVAVTSRDLVLVNQDHHVTRYAERYRSDVVAVAMLASAVYSSINLFYEEITDDHEQEYQAAFTLFLLDEMTR